DLCKQRSRREKMVKDFPPGPSSSCCSIGGLFNAARSFFECGRASLANNPRRNTARGFIACVSGIEIALHAEDARQHMRRADCKRARGMPGGRECDGAAAER